jgi:hypothetical protein
MKLFMLGPGRRRLLLVVSGSKLLGANVSPGSGSTLPLLIAIAGVVASFAGSALAAFFTDVFVLAFGASALATVEPQMLLLVLLLVLEHLT